MRKGKRVGRRVGRTGKGREAAVQKVAQRSRDGRAADDGGRHAPRPSQGAQLRDLVRPPPLPLPSRTVLPFALTLTRDGPAQCTSLEMLTDAQTTPCGHHFCRYALLCSIGRSSVNVGKGRARAYVRESPPRRAGARAGFLMTRACIAASLAARPVCPLCKAAITRRAMTPAASLARLTGAFTALLEAYEADIGQGTTNETGHRDMRTERAHGHGDGHGA